MNYFDWKSMMRKKEISREDGSRPFNWPDRIWNSLSVLRMRPFSCHRNLGMRLNDSSLKWKA